MTVPSLAPNVDRRMKTRTVAFVLIGIGVFVLKRQYTGPLEEIAHAYAGNLSVSFALYFVFMNLEFPAAIRKFAAASLALAAVESFEVFKGFGMMVNTNDPLDLVANAVGVLFALGLDSLLGTGSPDHPRAKAM